MTDTVLQRLPSLPWRRLLGAALLVPMFFAGMMEYLLATRGFQPTLKDSADLWITQRARAGDLGKHALILVGGSRMQFGIDLDTLQKQTGLESVQLAVSGSGFLAVLENLARDPSIRGTVVVDFADSSLMKPARGDAAAEFVQEYEHRMRAGRFPTFQEVEGVLTGLLHSRLRSYADGSRPLTALNSRVLARKSAPQYIHLRADREISADFSKVDMPGFYLRRVRRQMDEPTPFPAGTTWASLKRNLRAQIALLKPSLKSHKEFVKSTRKVAALTRTLQARGARVHFVKFPSSGLTRLIDRKSYPRHLFWDQFTAVVGAPALHYEKVRDMKRLVCPDGIHLDYRDKTHFTLTLVRVLGIKKDTLLRKKPRRPPPARRRAPPEQ